MLGRQYDKLRMMDRGEEASQRAKVWGFCGGSRDKKCRFRRYIRGDLEFRRGDWEIGEDETSVHALFGPFAMDHNAGGCSPGVRDLWVEEAQKCRYSEGRILVEYERQSRGVFWLMSLCWTGESVDVKGTGEGNRKGRQEE